MKYLKAVIVFIVFFHVQAMGQNLSYIGLDTITIYDNLKEALKNPDEVYGISLKKMKLKELPSELWQFKNLLYLDASKNQITEIPKNITDFSSLKVLDLSNNAIIAIPEEVYKLENLQFLQLGKNKIEYISTSIKTLQNLVYLDLWSNEFYNVPPEIGELKELKKLDLRLINLSNEKQMIIKSWLPHTTIYFSQGCNCD